MNSLLSPPASKGFEGLTVGAFESRKAAELARLISRFGGQPLVAPSMREIPLEENNQALEFGKQVLDGNIDILILLTGVGTQILFDVWKTTFPLPAVTEALSRTTLLARGPKSVLALKALHLTPDLTVPEPNTWMDILSTLDSAYPEGLSGIRIGVQEYGVSNEEFLNALKQRGAIVQSIPVYRWGLPLDLAPLQQILDKILTSTVDVLLFTNAAQVDHVIQILEPKGQRDQFFQVMRKTVIGSIGSITSERLQRHGMPVDIEPSHPKMGILVREASEQASAIRQRKRLQIEANE